MNVSRFLKEDFNTTSVVFFSAIFLAALLQTQLCNLFFIIYSCLWIYYKFNVKVKIEKREYVFLIIFSMYYALGISGFIHTQNLPVAFTWLESKVSFFALPVLVIFSPLTIKDINKIFNIFSFGIIVIGLIHLVLAVQSYMITSDINSLTYIQLLAPLDLHPTNFSLFCSFSIFHLYSTRNLMADTRGKKLGLFVAIGILILLDFLALSRVVIVGFVFVIILFFIFNMFSGKARTISYWVKLSVLFVLLLAIVPVIKDRFMLFRVSDPLGPETSNSTAFHIKSWYCSYLLLSDYHLLTGYGTGDEKDVLVECYQRFDWPTMVTERHNAHNEYLSVMLRHGVIGFLVLLAILFFPALIAFYARDYVHLGFILLVGVTLISHSLNQFHGLVFFCLASALLFKRTILKLNANLAPS